MNALSSSTPLHPLVAYLAATYTVFSPTRTLRIAIGHPCLDAPEREAVHAVLTACNPASRMLTDAENDIRTIALRDKLDALRLDWAQAMNAAPDGQWREPAFWIREASLDNIDSIALDCGQNACVVVEQDGIARLRVYRGDWMPADAGDVSSDWLRWHGAPSP